MNMIVETNDSMFEISIDYEEQIREKIFEHLVNSDPELLFQQQIYYETDNKIDEVVYAYVNPLDFYNTSLVFAWIECIPNPIIRKNKIQEYIQYLSDNDMISLSATKKYCELRLNTDNSYMSTIWSKYRDFEIISERLENGFYLIKNYPIRVGGSVYYIDTLYKEKDLD